MDTKMPDKNKLNKTSQYDTQLNWDWDEQENDFDPVSFDVSTSQSKSWEDFYPEEENADTSDFQASDDDFWADQYEAEDNFEPDNGKKTVPGRTRKWKVSGKKRFGKNKAGKSRSNIGKIKDYRAVEEAPVAEESSNEDEDMTFEEFYYYSADTYKNYRGGVKKTVEKGKKKQKKGGKPLFSAVFYLLGQRIKTGRQKRKEARQAFWEDIPIKEPKNLPRLAKKYAKQAENIIIRSRIALFICALMLIFSMTYELSGSAFIIGENGLVLTGVLMVMQLLVMLFCIEIPVTGFHSLLKEQFGAETLITASCIVTLSEGAVILATKNFANCLPFSVISALSVMFGMRGLASYKIAMYNSLRVVAKAETPCGITVDSESIEDRNVLKKQSEATSGFYKNLVQRDICEHVYYSAAPLMVLAAIIFAFLSTVVRGHAGDFIHALAALIAISASFSCLSAYSMTFKVISTGARRVGFAIAGWMGADKLFNADGVFITDNDIFPKGSQAIRGLRITDVVTQYRAIEYAGSVILESGSGLVNPFAELMRQQDVTPVNVDRFACYESGGIGGVIRNDNILVGTAAFMNLMGVRIPDNFDFKNAIFLSVNRRFAGAFSVRYTPANSVQRAMVAMRGVKMNMLFALRDFNISPKMLQQKFKVSMNGVEYIPLDECYKMDDQQKTDEETDVISVLKFSKFSTFAYAVTKGVKLRQISMLATAASVLGSAVGLLVVFLMCWNGPMTAITTWGMTIFMLAMYSVTVILANMSRRNK